MPTAHGRPVVLDTWLLIEHYEGNDPSSAAVDALLAQRRTRPIMSAATFTEVCYTLSNGHGADVGERESRELSTSCALSRSTPPPRP